MLLKREGQKEPNDCQVTLFHTKLYQYKYKSMHVLNNNPMVVSSSLNIWILACTCITGALFVCIYTYTSYDSTAPFKGCIHKEYNGIYNGEVRFRTSMVAYL